MLTAHSPMPHTFTEGPHKGVTIRMCQHCGKMMDDSSVPPGAKQGEANEPTRETAS